MTIGTSKLFDLNDIFDSILEDKSIVVLGPNFYADTEKGTHEQQLLTFFKEIGISYQHYYKDDGFFLFDEENQRTKACRKIKQFYKHIAPNEHLRKIAQIPFHIYMTVTPDKLLHQTFKELEYPAPQLAHYKKGTEPQKIMTPTKNNPLVYNVFGILDDQESIVLTHDDLYDYFKSIFSLKSMPEKVRRALREVENIIFLGVPFQKWYMNLLLREFGAHENKKIIRFAADQTVSDNIRTFCHQQFKIHFIDHNITKFVEMLYDKFKDEKSLRTRMVQQTKTTMEGCKVLFVNNDFNALFEELRKHTTGTELYNEVIKQESSHNKLEEQINKSLISEEQQKIQYAETREAILELMKEIENH